VSATGEPVSEVLGTCWRSVVISTDQGLEQDFNSLDAQYDASQAYIRSQGPCRVDAVARVNTTMAAERPAREWNAADLPSSLENADLCDNALLA
jgi:hypothetical protein